MYLRGLVLLLFLCCCCSRSAAVGAAVFFLAVLTVPLFVLGGGVEYGNFGELMKTVEIMLLIIW